MTGGKDKRINKIIVILYLIGSLAIGINSFVTGSQRAYFAFTMPLFLCIPLILEKIFRLGRNYILNSIMYVFFFFAFCVGVIGEIYSISQFYDKIVHGFSGVLFAYMGAYIYYLISGRSVDKIVTKAERAVYICFSVFFSLVSGYVWELMEYLATLITGQDPQWVELTGVGDTMQDMFSCLVGAILTGCYFIYRFIRWERQCGTVDHINV